MHETEPHASELPAEPAREPLLSVLMPVYNELPTLRKILDRVLAVPIDKEIVVVDDGSTDGSRELLRELARAGDPRLRVVFHQRNQGKTAAVRTAIAQARGRIAIVQDADLEYDPADYPKLVGPIERDVADVVYGSRFLGTERRVLLFWHTLGNRLLTTFSNAFTNLNLTDLETGYKAFRSDLLKSIPISSSGFGFEAEVTVKVAQLGARLYEVPISYHGREYWEGKKIGWKDGVQALWLIVRHTLAPSDAGFATLRRLDRLRRYNRFLVDEMRPWLRGRTLEIGSGTGAISRQLVTQPELVVSDPRREYRDLLRHLFAEYEHVEVVPFTLGEPRPAALAGRRFDTVVCANVLEHVEDDGAGLRQVFELLEPGGSLVLVVPMLSALYGQIDRAIHHHRRYDRAQLEERLRKAGFEVVRVEALNALAIPGWWLNSRVLRRSSVPGFQARVNDWLVPWLRVERRLGLPIGISILAVGRRPAGIP